MKRYILSGGLIVLAFGSILGLLLFSVAFSAHDSDAYGVIAEKIFNFFATILLIAPLSGQGFSFGESLLISAVYLFLIGALIGWVYGKNKLPIK